MEKEKLYNHTLFSADVLKQATNEFIKGRNFQIGLSTIKVGNETWKYDDLNEFYSAYRNEKVTYVHYTLNIKDSQDGFGIVYAKDLHTEVSVKSNNRGNIESVFEIFEKNHEDSKVPQQEYSDEFEPTIFIGHGRSMQWRDLKDHLSDKHDYEIVAYETGARAGHTIRDILDEMSSESTFAILVMTGEDKDSDGKMNARPNVIHEIGLFQGRLGFSRAIVLLEEGTEEFSNLQGIQQIRYSKNNIKETFGEVLATIKREFE
jgi:predicted nucleotide-binding protein